MTAKYIQNRDTPTKVLVTAFSDEGKAIRSFYLKPKMINFITTEVISGRTQFEVVLKQEPSENEKKYICDFSGLRLNVGIGGLKKTIPASIQPQIHAETYYSIARNAQFPERWLTENGWSDKQACHSINSFMPQSAEVNKCDIQHCLNVMPNDVTIQTDSEKCWVCERLIVRPRVIPFDVTPLPKTKKCLNCRNNVAEKAIFCSYCGGNPDIEKVIVKTVLKKVCKYTGHSEVVENSARAKFCRSCGKPDYLVDVYE